MYLIWNIYYHHRMKRYYDWSTCLRSKFHCTAEKTKSENHVNVEQNYRTKQYRTLLSCRVMSFRVVSQTLKAYEGEVDLQVHNRSIKNRTFHWDMIKIFLILTPTGTNLTRVSWSKTLFCKTRFLSIMLYNTVACF